MGPLQFAGRRRRTFEDPGWYNRIGMARYSFFYPTCTLEQPAREGYSCQTFVSTALAWWPDVLPENPPAAQWPFEQSADLADVQRWLGPPETGGDNLITDQLHPTQLGAVGDSLLWATVSQLQWTLRSDHTITEDDVRGRLSKMHCTDPDGAACLRQAFRALIAGLIEAYPDLAGEECVPQLVALGRDMAFAAAEGPGLLQYIKNELQPVCLPALLGI